MTDPFDLIARLEAANGPSRELDRAIALAKGWHRVEPRHIRSKHGGWISPEDWRGRYSTGAPILDGLHGTTIHRDPPRFTASVDAALTLVPEGSDWSVGYIHANGFVSASVMWQAKAGSRFHEFFDAEPETVVWWGEHGKALTPALAICITSFKAK